MDILQTYLLLVRCLFFFSFFLFLTFSFFVIDKGIILWQVLSENKKPIRAGPEFAFRPGDRPEDVPQDPWDLMLQCVATNPEERPKILEVIERLKAFEKVVAPLNTNDSTTDDKRKKKKAHSSKSKGHHQRHKHGHRHQSSRHRASSDHKRNPTTTTGDASSPMNLSKSDGIQTSSAGKEEKHEK